MILPRVTFLIRVVGGGLIYPMLLRVFLIRYCNSNFGYGIDLQIDPELLIELEQSVKVTFGPNFTPEHLSDGPIMTFVIYDTCNVPKRKYTDHS